MDRFLSAAGRDWPAPAKINLFLHVIGRRADGYHLLQTAFQFLDLHDTLHFTPREDGRVCRRGGLAGVPQDQDLVVRAGLALREDLEEKRAFSAKEVVELGTALLDGLLNASKKPRPTSSSRVR